jgi:hypothetical protein
MVSLAHVRVAPTAYSVARSRALSDIPFSKEIAIWLEKEIGDPKRIVSDAYKPRRVITIEARYKLIDKLIKKIILVKCLNLLVGYFQEGIFLLKIKPLT